jgi:hypothetical protein
VGANSRDRIWEADVRRRAREVRELDRQGLALHLIVAGSRGFNDRGFVADVLDLVHRKRGIASLCYCDTATRATSYADRWAHSRHIRVFWLAPDRILRHRPLHGVVAFGGPEDFIARAREAGLKVWLRRAPQGA